MLSQQSSGLKLSFLLMSEGHQEKRYLSSIRQKGKSAGMAITCHMMLNTSAVISLVKTSLICCFALLLKLLCLQVPHYQNILSLNIFGRNVTCHLGETTSYHLKPHRYLYAKRCSALLRACLTVSPSRAAAACLQGNSLSSSLF